MNWVLAVLKKYAVFSGRARRKEFWMFYLFIFIGVIVAAILDNRGYEICGCGIWSVNHPVLFSDSCPSVGSWYQKTP